MYFNAHAHSSFSLADGVALVEDYVARLKDLGHTHATITDHGSMAAMPRLWRAARKQGLTPVAGCEVYVAAKGRRTRTDKDLPKEENDRIARSHHLTLLARDRTGYENLIALSGKAWTEGFYRKPRVDEELLARHGEGIVCLSGCLAGTLSAAILRGDEAEADRLLDFYTATYPGRFFLELQNHGDLIPDQVTLNRALLRLSRKHGIPAVGTNDSHFCMAEDARTHRFLLDSSPATRGFESSPHAWVRDNASMAQAFGDGALLRNTLVIASMCEDYDLGESTPRLPVSPIETLGEDPAERMRKLAERGLQIRLQRTWETVPQVYRDRLAYELDVIRTMGEKLGVPFERYLFLVADVARFARSRRIRFGPRGSAAGSLLCWVLQISSLDPVKDDLSFERFLNPDRVTLPDIDLDFADDRRDEVFQYLKDTYGDENVARIATYGVIGPKAAIWDACRMLEAEATLKRNSGDLARELSGLVPYSQHEQTMDDVLGDREAPLAQRVAQDREAAAVIERARRISGRFKSSGVHACGVVVSDRPVGTLVPLASQSPEKAKDEIIPVHTQYEMNELESLGLLKLDLLGLKEHAKMGEAIARIEAATGTELDVDRLPLDDAAAWDVIASGDTLGLFQLGSPGMIRALAQIQPRSIPELALVMAAYRPGPMESIPAMGRRKRGEETVDYPHPKLEEILDWTFGFPVFQEQIMRLLQVLAGYSAPESDLVRKAIGKKDPQALVEHGKRFREGCLAHGISEQEAETVWNLILPFSGYGFNKAHAWAYAYLGFQSAWLKAHHPLAFYTAAFNVEARTKSGQESAQERIAMTAAEARRRGIALLPPDVNHSAAWFEPDGPDSIRYGLAAVKDVGEKAAQQIVANAPYADLYDLMARCPANKKALLALAEIGAMPWGDRDETVARIERDHALKRFARPLPRRGETTQEARERGRVRLAEEFAVAAREPVAVVATGQVERLGSEVDRLGAAFTPFPAIPGSRKETEIANLGKFVGERLTVNGMVASVAPFVAKGSRVQMGRATLIDETGRLRLLFFGKPWEETQHLMTTGAMVSVQGRISCDLEETDGDEPPPASSLVMKVSRVEPLSLERGAGFSVVSLDGYDGVEEDDAWDGPERTGSSGGRAAARTGGDGGRGART